MRTKVLKLTLVVFILFIVAGANADSGVQSSPYPLQGVSLDTGLTQLAPMAITCGPWSSWFTSVSYCKTDIAGVLCICTTLPLSVEFADQYRSRTCTNSITGGITTEYQFRTKRTGCCGLEVFPCNWD